MPKFLRALDPAIAQLARKADCTVEDMRRYVVRDGLAATIEDVHEAAAANIELNAGYAVPHAEAMRRARAIVERHARKHKSAG